MSMTNDDHTGGAPAIFCSDAAPSTLRPPMVAPKDRRSVNAFLTDEARQGWTEFARTSHVTVSALLEVLGRRLNEGRPPVLDSEAVAEARNIDGDRRSRRKEWVTVTVRHSAATPRIAARRSAALRSFAGMNAEYTWRVIAGFA